MRKISPLLALAVLALTIPAFAGAPFYKVKEEYQKKITEDGHADERGALIEKVAAFDDSEAAQVLVDSLKDLSRKIDALNDEADRVATKLAPIDSEVDVKRDHYATRDALRRKARKIDGSIIAEHHVMKLIGEALQGMKDPKARVEVEKLAKRSGDWRQREIAGVAVTTYAGVAATEAAIGLLADKKPRVLVAVLDGLAKRRDPKTVEAVAKCLLGHVWVVQIAAAQALGAIGSPKAIAPLIEALGKTDGRTQTEMNKALQRITGQRFTQDDSTSWRRWYAANKAKLLGTGAKPLARGGTSRKGDSGSTYYGIHTRSRRIVYIIDISGSMNLKMKEHSKGHYSNAGEPMRTKLQIAQSALHTAVESLPEKAEFDIITFNNLVKVWRPSLVKATRGTKQKAFAFIDTLSASGSTYTYGALKEAFKLAGMGARDRHYESGVDTIFLMSDGAPTDQAFPTSHLMDPDKILKAVRDWNSLSKVVIHAIAIDPVTQGPNFIAFMKELAEQNGGKYEERN